MEYKTRTPCAVCGLCKDAKHMDWDHLPGTTKVAAVSTLMWQGREKAMRAEILKCELVCRSCHTKRSIQRKQLHGPWNGV